MFMDKDKDMDKKDPDFKEYVDEKVSKLEELIKNQTDTIESMKRKMDVKIEETSTSGFIESENGQETLEEQETALEQEPVEEQELALEQEPVETEQEPVESAIAKKSQIIANNRTLYSPAERASAHSYYLDGGGKQGGNLKHPPCTITPPTTNGESHGLRPIPIRKAIHIR
jgi:hypothetical protein